MSDINAQKDKDDLFDLHRETTKNIMKVAFKEAAKEWLDDLFATFGRWSLFSIGGAAVVGLGYFLLWTNGWRK